MHKSNVADGDLDGDSVGIFDGEIFGGSGLFSDAFDADKFSDTVRGMDDKVSAVDVGERIEGSDCSYSALLSSEQKLAEKLMVGYDYQAE